jgi:hypothetical protein
MASTEARSPDTERGSSIARSVDADRVDLAGVSDTLSAIEANVRRVMEGDSEAIRLAVGIKLATVAIAVGVAVPTLLLEEDWDAWISVGAQPGTQDHEPIAHISRALDRPEPYDVLRVRTNQRTYLRIAGLDAFEGSTWRLDPEAFDGATPDPDGLVPAEGALPPEQHAMRFVPVAADIEVLEFASAFLPAPYQPRELEVTDRAPLSWSARGGVLVDVASADGSARTRSTDGLEYRVVARRPAPDAVDLADVAYDPDLVARNTQLPRE